MNSKLNYKEYGSGEPIYFLHGLALDKTSMEYIYEPQFDNTSKYRRVYIDIPGMGYSPLDSNTNSTDDVFNIIKEFILLDSANHPINICGHSFGGYLCLGLAYELKKKVNKFFLTCPVIIAKQHDRHLEPHINIFEEIENDNDNKKDYKDYLDMNVLINKKTWDDYKLSIVPGLELFDNVGWSRILNYKYSLNSEKKIAANPPSTKGYILLGEYDNIVGYKDQIRILGGKEYYCRVIANSGHNIQIDSKKDIENYFKKFLAI